MGKIRGMKSSTRRLIFSNVTCGAPVAGHCSVCHRPFEIAFDDKMTLGEAHDRLAEMFNVHVCNEEVNQAAARIVRETAEDQ
jgi:hypothetical protein